MDVSLPIGELNKIAAAADGLSFMGGSDHGVLDPTAP